MIRDGSSLGPVRWDSDTALTFRREVLRPFLDQHLKEGAPVAGIAPVTAFETGVNLWRRLDAWPSGCAGGCPPRPTPLYLRAGAQLDFVAPAAGEVEFTEYVSDPARPVPYRARPIDHSDPDGWRRWLVEDQREASGRTDVVTFVSEGLTEPVRLAGAPITHLIASTTGTDSDWVVKLIDLYPPEVAADPRMGGYQLMVSGDIFRGRYRESFETPTPIASDEPLAYRFRLPTVSHTFKPGHRIVVQVQSSWFPLYDRNPQRFVPSIFDARPEDFRKATQRVWHAPGHASYVELPVVAAP
jgi:putative CocE/NonD family hydrolase